MSTVLVAGMKFLLCVDRYVGCIGGCDDTLVELFDLNKTLRRNPPPPAGKVTTCPIKMSHLSASEPVSVDETYHNHHPLMDVMSSSIISYSS